MNIELVNYIETNIFKIYDKNEKGHGILHIKEVIERSLELAKNYDVNQNMVYVIASYHDLGHHIDKDTHELISGKMLYDDVNLQKWFTMDEINIMKEAVFDHRASLNREPRSIYGKIISSADRGIPNFKTRVLRSYYYGLRHFSELSLDEQLKRIYTHLKEKYGLSGYAKIYITDEKYDNALKEFNEMLNNKELFIKKAYELIEKERSEN